MTAAAAFEEEVDAAAAIRRIAITVCRDAAVEPSRGREWNWTYQLAA